ncbi:MAG: DsrE family protein [Chloroflexi bacterium]|nr:DsrE family protein [Chloroflexota bacterium]
MARSMGIVVRAAPYGTISAAEALRHAVAGISFGISTTLFLLEDGVYVAQVAQDAVLYLLRGGATLASESVGRALETGVSVYYLEDDLAARGFGRDDIRAGCRPLSYGDLVDLMLEDGQVPLGAL